VANSSDVQLQLRVLAERAGLNITMAELERLAAGFEALLHGGTVLESLPLWATEPAAVFCLAQAEAAPPVQKQALP
jgi:hypothetical protein